MKVNIVERYIFLDTNAKIYFEYQVILLYISSSQDQNNEDIAFYNESSIFKQDSDVQERPITNEVNL